MSWDGKVQPLAVACSTTFVDETVALPGAPPYYLILETFDETPLDCNYPFSPKHAAYVIDEYDLK